MRTRLSHSQLTAWAGCWERYRLERIEKVPSVPGWALIGGSAVHEATENYDRNRLGITTPLVEFREIMERRIVEAEDETGVSRDAFKASGRASKENPNKEDLGWWLKHGPAMVNRWINFTNMSGLEVWITPNGEPAVEVEFELLLNNDVTVKGYVDRVMVDRLDRLVVVDIKTGASKQPTPRQLGTYKVGLEDKWPYLAFNQGMFWDARAGITSTVSDLSGYTRARIEWQYGKVRAAREQGIFIANPSSLCGSCGVKDYCYEYTPDADAAVRPPWLTVEEWGLGA